MQGLPKKSYTVAEATKKLEPYCAYQERCHKEVVDKLKQLHMIPEAIDHIIYHLIQENFLNEECFAKAFTRGKFRHKNWGKIRITRELKLRQISKFNIKSGLQEISEEAYQDKIIAITTKKLQSLLHLPPNKQKQKLIYYLQYRGWETGLIYDTITQIMQQQD
jgi:regulatory protein